MHLKSRIERLERGARGSVTLAELERAETVFHTWHRVSDNPSRATDEDRRLLAEHNWQRAMAVLIQALGGLEMAVRLSFGQRAPGPVGT